MNNRLIIWMTGLSGAGKTTLAHGLMGQLRSQGITSFLLDGDILRKGINSDLDFSRAGRKENVRRISEIARLFAEADIVPVIAVISPYQEDRDEVRARLANYCYREVYVKCSIDVCEQRDPKGLYKKARQQAIPNFTGITDVFEPPVTPDIVIDTERYNYINCLTELYNRLTNPEAESYQNAAQLEAEYR